ncbi:GNVR domain-containing protein [Acidovorax carolinensis]|uniref:GNVR domain-containing protein n=1 Tax=Acidovorax carolinensis TaxID=553814 RepID=UPI0012FF6B65|nr:GNVR domain-containing protein [Acidovorax carolinensis]
MAHREQALGEGVGSAHGWLVCLVGRGALIVVARRQPRSEGGGYFSSLLEQYTPDQVFAYFLRRLLTDEAKQRFFQEIYLPAQDRAPDNAAARQALYQHMSQKVLTVTPPPPKKGRDLYSVRIEAPSGEKAADWTNNFLNQVAEDATRSLFNDAEKAIALQMQNTERDLEEKLRITEQTRNDRQAQLTEALQVALAVGIRDPQMTSAQPPRQDGVASVIDGSRLYARGSKSLQAELAVLKNRKDDAPFVDGLRAAQSQLRLLSELKTAEKKFKIFHIDGQVIAPEKPFAPKKSIILALGLFMGLCLGVLTALVRTGVIKQLMAADDTSNTPAYATRNLQPAFTSTTSSTATATAKQLV